MRFYDEENEEGLNNPSEEPEVDNNASQNNIPSQVGDKLNDKLKKDLAKKAGKTAATKGSLAASLGPILFWVAIVILALIIIVGIIMFFMTMPGMVMAKLKELGLALANGLSSWFGYDDTSMIEEESIYGSLNYLEEMGYDLKGFGFLTEYKTSNTESENEKKDGVIRDSNGKIIDASSDFITTYLVSDNYVYTIANHNLVTGSSSNFFSWLWDRVQAIGAHLADFFGGSYGTNFTRGLLNFYYQGPKGVGDRGKFYSDTGLFNFDELDINPENKTITIGKSNIFDPNKSMTYSLEGWTGRYGMPIDFLLSVHVATMMPDLAYDMANSFETKINIIVYPVTNAQIDAAYKTETDYIDYSKFEKYANKDKFLWIFSDNEFSNKEATALMMAFGIPSPEGICPDICYTGDPIIEVTEDMDIDEVCDICTKYLQSIYSALANAKDAHYEYYIPYIESVENHWYRDVYFAVNDDNNADRFIKTDYDYETKVRERWTLYETYPTDPNAAGYIKERAGEYKLYEIYSVEENPDMAGEYKGLFNGTEAEAKEQGILVAKKAVSVDATDTGYLDDIQWNKPEGGVWSAYKSSKPSESWKRTFTNDEIKELSDSEKHAKERIYTQIKSQGVVSQKGEGQRGETNPTIKKMFLSNTYFRYDGNAETAETITQMRDKIKASLGSDGVQYGPLNALKDGNKTKDFTDKMLDANGNLVQASDDSEGKKISDYSGQVVLNQDSLNAFSMLENTDTLDSDYIYRDFKELVVELGYFSREELADETPRVISWLVPETGSLGYPAREIDKRENEYGTMIHSEGDIDASEWNTIAKLIESVGNEVDDKDIVSDESQTGHFAVDTVGSSIISNIDLESADFLNTVGASVGPGDVSPSDVSADEFIEKTREMCEIINQEGYDYCVGRLSKNCPTCDEACKAMFESTGRCQKPGGCSCREIHCSHIPHQNPCGLPGSFEASMESIERHNLCCATLVSWALQNVGVMPEGKSINGAGSLGKYCVEVLGGEVIEVGDELLPGDIVVEGTKHIDIFGEPVGGRNAKYNGGAYVKIGATEGQPNSAILHNGGWDEDDTYAVRLFKDEDEPVPYTGYNGDEAVVSPVTGILLEYGTYNSQDIDSVTGEEYRVNVDLKYGPLVVPSDETFESKTVSDKVGYAKILVLDKENYLKLESGTNNSWRTSSLINENGTFNDPLKSSSNKKAKEILDGWSAIDKTVYAYKEFLELYEFYGIAGYTVYIDGFVCELPDESMREDDNRDSKIPNGERLSLRNFQSITPGNLNLDSSEQKDNTMYEAPDKYKLASKSATEKLEAEEKAKEEASISLYTNDLIFIKEGTIIGRTMTDKELLEASYLRNGQYGIYDEKRTGEAKDDEIIGNYLRIIMRDLDGTPVENVEDFMKIDLDDKMDEAILFMAGVLTAEAGGKGRGAQACAWVIRNRLESGQFGETLAEILVAPGQFTVVATDPAECSGWVPNGETISITVKGVTYYVAKPIDEAIEIARGVWNDAFPNEIDDRMYWKSADTELSIPYIQIPEGSGNKFHY